MSIKFGSKNLLETQVYKYELQDEGPNYYREFFNYEEIPKVAFNFRNVPMQTPEEIWITDTTFRDGQQSTAPFTVDQIVDLYRLLGKLGGPKGIVRPVCTPSKSKTGTPSISVFRSFLSGILLLST